MTNILNYNEWTRKGRGLRFEFCSSDDDISSLIRNNFFDESEFQLYIIAGYFVKNANEYIPKSCKILPEDIPKFKQNGVWDFFIGAEEITPSAELISRKDKHIGLIAPCNGLINLQYGRMTKIGTAHPSVGLVHKVINYESGEVIEHKTYEKMFRKFIRTLKK